MGVCDAVGLGFDEALGETLGFWVVEASSVGVGVGFWVGGLVGFWVG